MANVPRPTVGRGRCLTSRRCSKLKFLFEATADPFYRTLFQTGRDRDAIPK
ncbi:MAG: hypothetical protein R3F59_30070 [Myxococcota bacterium]